MDSIFLVVRWMLGSVLGMEILNLGEAIWSMSKCGVWKYLSEWVLNVFVKISFVFPTRGLFCIYVLINSACMLETAY